MSTESPRILWQERRLKNAGRRRAGVPCLHEMARSFSEATYFPVVVVGAPGAERIVHRFGTGVAQCCQTLDHHPEGQFARLAFWATVGDSWSRAPVAVALERDRLETALAERVKPRTHEEWLMWLSYQARHARGIEGLPAEYHAGAASRAWDKVRARHAVYWRTRGRGSMPFVAWDAMTPDPTDPFHPANRGAGPTAGGASAGAGRGRAERPAPSGSPFDGFDFPPMPGTARTAPPGALRTLGLTWPCSETDVRAAWRRCAAKAHPDAPGGSHDAFLAVTRARDELLVVVAEAS